MGLSPPWAFPLAMETACPTGHGCCHYSMTLKSLHCWHCSHGLRSLCATLLLIYTAHGKTRTAVQLGKGSFLLLLLPTYNLKSLWHLVEVSCGVTPALPLPDGRSHTIKQRSFPASPMWGLLNPSYVRGARNQIWDYVPLYAEPLSYATFLSCTMFTERLQSIDVTLAPHGHWMLSQF